MRSIADRGEGDASARVRGGCAEFRGGRPLFGRSDPLLFFWPLHGLRGDVPFSAGGGDLPAGLTRQVRTRYRNTATLGNLLHEVNNNLQMTGFDEDFPRVANMVNETGKKAVHQGLLSEDEARECLQNARKALQLLLRS